jgi:hypothetical protein
MVGYQSAQPDEKTFPAIEMSASIEGNIQDGGLD